MLCKWGDYLDLLIRQIILNPRLILYLIHYVEIYNKSLHVKNDMWKSRVFNSWGNVSKDEVNCLIVTSTIISHPDVRKHNAKRISGNLLIETGQWQDWPGIIGFLQPVFCFTSNNATNVEYISHRIVISLFGTKRSWKRWRKWGPAKWDAMLFIAECSRGKFWSMGMPINACISFGCLKMTNWYMRYWVMKRQSRHWRSNPVKIV